MTITRPESGSTPRYATVADLDAMRGDMRREMRDEIQIAQEQLQANLHRQREEEEDEMTVSNCCSCLKDTLYWAACYLCQVLQDAWTAAGLVVSDIRRQYTEISSAEAAPLRGPRPPAPHPSSSRYDSL